MRRLTLAGALIALLSSTSFSGWLGPFWARLASIWSESSTDVGCGMDPDGRCNPPQTPHTDEGCGWDPNGRCIPPQTLQTDEGCGMDPDGRCISGS